MSRTRSSEQRSDPRLRLDVQVEVLPLDGRLSSFSSQARDFSMQGIFLDSTRLPEIDTLLLLIIHPSDGGPPLKLTAQVVHRIAGRGFGCRFIDVGALTSTRVRRITAAAR